MRAVDALIVSADHALRTLAGPGRPRRASPVVASHDDFAAPLSESDRRLSGALMRVNHVGEVCAQALYVGQALATANPELRAECLSAAAEEADHLAWTHQRLRDLNDRPSLLNPLWYAGAFVLGLAAGRAGDAIGRGFVVETERQVEAHLQSHLERLPTADTASRAIVAEMKADEVRHATQAQAAGAAALPMPVRSLMHAAGRVMTTVAHRI
jgi:3-demethoxyubiquinol 3-hydroxylase